MFELVKRKKLTQVQALFLSVAESRMKLSTLFAVAIRIYLIISMLVNLESLETRGAQELELYFLSTVEYCKRSE